MKIYQYIQNYKIEVVNKPFTLENGIELKQTAKITFTDINNNLIERKDYGVIDIESIYESIHKKDSVDVSQCLVRNFSLPTYRRKYKLRANERIDLIDFTANNALF